MRWFTQRVIPEGGSRSPLFLGVGTENSAASLPGLSTVHLRTPEVEGREFSEAGRSRQTREVSVTSRVWLGKYGGALLHGLPGPGAIPRGSWRGVPMRGPSEFPRQVGSSASTLAAATAVRAAVCVAVAWGLVASALHAIGVACVTIRSATRVGESTGGPHVATRGVASASAGP